MVDPRERPKCYSVATKLSEVCKKSDDRSYCLDGHPRGEVSVGSSHNVSRTCRQRMTEAHSGHERRLVLSKDSNLFADAVASALANATRDMGEIPTGIPSPASLESTNIVEAALGGCLSPQPQNHLDPVTGNLPSPETPLPTTSGVSAINSICDDAGAEETTPSSDDNMKPQRERAEQGAEDDSPRSEEVNQELNGPQQEEEAGSPEGPMAWARSLCGCLGSRDDYRDG